MEEKAGIGFLIHMVVTQNMAVVEVEEQEKKYMIMAVEVEEAPFMAQGAVEEEAQVTHLVLITEDMEENGEPMLLIMLPIED